jgi:5-methylthioadenosine/S-adenosylhomocysteine deaminase
MTLFRGLADDLPLEAWLSEHIFPAEARCIDPDSARLGALLGIAEMLLSGTTTCCDGYFHEGEIAAAALESGIRAILGQGVLDFPAPGIPDPADAVNMAEAFADAWCGVSDRISPSIFCHSPYTCSEKTLRAAKTACRKRGIRFQIHVAETRGELERCLTEKRASPIAYLDRLGVLDENTLLVHAVWVVEGDIRIMQNRRVSVSANPESNMKLASGIAPIPDFIAAGIAVGLGTDGCASNNDLDLFQAMDVAAKLHKLERMDPTAMDAQTVLRMATIEGARALGLDRITGSLEIGKAADVIVVDTAKPHLVPLYHPVSHLVYAAKGSDVRDVLIGGRLVVRNRELLTLDLAEILDRANCFARRVSGI